jgi:hypothetical protein
MHPDQWASIGVKVLIISTYSFRVPTRVSNDQNLSKIQISPYNCPDISLYRPSFARIVLHPCDFYKQIAQGCIRQPHNKRLQ